jgi:hypothetical protein
MSGFLGSTSRQTPPPIRLQASGPVMCCHSRRRHRSDRFRLPNPFQSPTQAATLAKSLLGWLGASQIDLNNSPSADHSLADARFCLRRWTKSPPAPPVLIPVFPRAEAQFPHRCINDLRIRDHFHIGPADVLTFERTFCQFCPPSDK